MARAKKLGVSYSAGRELVKLLPKLNVEISGYPLELDDNADRVQDWALHNWVDGTWGHVADFSSKSMEYSAFYRQIVWTGNTTTTPVTSEEIIVGVMASSSLASVVPLVIKAVLFCVTHFLAIENEAN